MKKFNKTILLSFCIAAIFNSASAQKMLDAVPERVSFHQKIVEEIFHLNAGSSVDIRFNESLRITGIIKSNEKVYDNLQTIVIECTNYNKARLFVSRSIDENNQIKYTGRMLGRGYQDGFELRSDKTGNSITKINIKEMIVD